MNNNMTYSDSIHRLGRITMVIMTVVLLMIPTMLCITSGVWPEGDVFFKSLVAVGGIYIPIGVIEMLNYSPMLGSGGTYLAFLSGNISNLKLPCALNTLEVTRVKPGSEEGEVLSTISIAVSTMVTTVIMCIGVLLILPFKDFFIEELSPISEYIMPSIFGGLGVVFISKYWKMAILPLVLMTALFIFVVKDDSIRSVFVPIASIISVAAARYMYKKEWL